LRSLFKFKGSPDEETLLQDTFKGVDEIITRAETSESLRLRFFEIAPLAQVLLRALEEGVFSDSARATAISLAARLPASTMDSVISPESLKDGLVLLQYL
jgi:hypothetical protein